MIVFLQVMGGFLLIGIVLNLLLAMADHLAGPTDDM